MATNRFAGQANMFQTEYPIVQASSVRQMRCNQCAERGLLHEQINALIRFIAMNSPRRVAVVSTAYTLLLSDFFPSGSPHDICSIDLRGRWLNFQLSHDDNSDNAAAVDVVLIPIAVNWWTPERSYGSHIALAIYDREAEDDTIHHFDSQNLRLGLRDRVAVIHAVRHLTGRELPVRVHSVNEMRHNQQMDTDSTCAVHAIRNAESWLFNNKQLFNPNLDIAAHRVRMVKMLEQLLQDTLPEYTPPVYEEYNAENLAGIGSFTRSLIAGTMQ